MVKHSTVENLQGHNRIRRKINFGLVPNFLVFTCYHGGFFCLLCLKLDNVVNTSFFIILIPLWVFLLYFSIFLIITGLASTNQRVNKCERVTLSGMVPIGLILTLILCMCLIDEIAVFPVYAAFIPLLASLIFAYLYIRCLVRPANGDVGKVKPQILEQAPLDAS